MDWYVDLWMHVWIGAWMRRGIDVLFANERRTHSRCRPDFRRQKYAAGVREGHGGFSASSRSRQMLDECKRKYRSISATLSSVCSRVCKRHHGHCIYRTRRMNLLKQHLGRKTLTGGCSCLVLHVKICYLRLHQEKNCTW